MARVERLRTGKSGRVTRKALMEGGQLIAFSNFVPPKNGQPPHHTVAIECSPLDSGEGYRIEMTAEDAATLADKLNGIVQRIARQNAMGGEHK